MFIEESKVDYRDGQKYLKISAYSQTVPATMPEPADIPGFDDTYDFMPGSTIYIVSTGALYMSGEDGNWYQQ